MTNPASQRTFMCMSTDWMEGEVFLTFEYNSLIYTAYMSRYSYSESSPYDEYFETTIASMNPDGTNWQIINVITLINLLTNVVFYDGIIYFTQDTYQEDLSLVTYSIIANSFNITILGDSLRWFGDDESDHWSYSSFFSLHTDSSGVHIGYMRDNYNTRRREIWFAHCNFSGGGYEKVHVTENFTQISITGVPTTRTIGYSGVIENMHFMPTSNGYMYLWRDNANYSYNSGYISYCLCDFSGGNATIFRSSLYTYTLNPQHLIKDDSYIYCLFDSYFGPLRIIRYDSSGNESDIRSCDPEVYTYYFNGLVSSGGHLYLIFNTGDHVIYFKYNTSFSSFEETILFSTYEINIDISSPKVVVANGNVICVFAGANTLIWKCRYMWTYPGNGPITPTTAQCQVTQTLIDATTGKPITLLGGV